MDRNESRLTVLFQPPFWVGIAERWSSGGYQAAQAVFGPEPTDAQVYQWLEREWHRLRFTSAAAGEGPGGEIRNPKRRQRQARQAAQTGRGCTKAQEVLSRQREQEGQLRQDRRCQRQREDEERKFLLKQQKKREKQRGR